MEREDWLFAAFFTVIVLLVFGGIGWSIWNDYRNAATELVTVQARCDAWEGLIAQEFRVRMRAKRVGNRVFCVEGGNGVLHDPEEI